MTKETAIERIKKAEETISRKLNTIDKKQKSIVKKQAEVEKLIGECPDHILYLNEMEALNIDRETANKVYWLLCDISTLKEDIRRGYKEIKEKEDKLPEYRKALEEAEQRERIIANEIPESMKAAKEELIEAWTNYDIALREKLRKAKREMGYSEFFKKYSYSTYESVNKSDEELRKANEKEATFWLLDLYNRVKDITGDITDSKNLRWGGKALNGYIVGKNGIADVFTIEAGGYNIQRWHLRVLVKARH